MLPATLSIEDVSVEFRSGGARIAAVERVSMSVAPAECVGIVGESGSGKTQLFMAAMGLLPSNAAVSGSVKFQGEELLGAATADLNRFRGSKLAMIFQDPMTSLTPHLRIGAQLAEVLVCHAGLTHREAWASSARMLERVRVSEAPRRMQQYPHELSGGMRQRVMIAMSLLCNPALVIADEPTTALDVTLQAQIMDLLRAVRADFGMALALISHDMAVVAALADRILVMYAGRIVEDITAGEQPLSPRHPYTAALLRCIPNLHAPRPDRLATLAGQPPRPGERIEGCAFAARCPRVMARCKVETPAFQGPQGRSVACHYPLAS
jgi:oligopeptide transport system ATP-binding protein